MKKLLFLLGAVLCSYLTTPLLSQNLTISGTIKDATSGESLIGATIQATQSDIGISTNTYGFYSLTLPQKDTLILVINYLGYQPQIKHIQTQKDLRLDIQLQPNSLELGTVEVIANKTGRQNVSETQMGVINVPIKLVKELPAILGEADVLKVIQLLPGVQSGNEGTTGFHVRGGNADQNLVQLDEATVYNPNHLFGLMSTFNTAAINNVKLVKGGFPVQYGGRLSSILDISMKEGNNQTFKGEGGIGVISSRLTLEGPLVKEKSSFILSGRRTYLDLIAKPFIPNNIKTTYNFYDLNLKINHHFSPNDRLFFSMFKGNDRLNYDQSGILYNINFGNTTSTLRWNHIYGKKLFSNTSIIYNEFEHIIDATQNNVNSNVLAGIRDWSVKMEFQYFPKPRHQIRFGGIFQNHRLRSDGNNQINPGTQANPDLTIERIPFKTFNEWAGYLEDEIRFSSKFSTTVGLRLPIYQLAQTQYVRVEPRVSAKLELDKQTSIKGAYTKMNQFLHLIPGTAASIPYDIWAPSTNQTKPQSSQQISLGLFKNFKENAFETSLEVYYKNMDNQILFREGNQLVQSLDIDKLLVYGKGWSYGAEFFVQKNVGKLTGWVSYTLSWTEQKFDDLNFGKTFPFRYDKRHNLSVTGSYALNDKWTLSAAFIFNSGAAFTVPTGRIAAQNGGSLFEGNYYIYESRNNIRLPNYHRLDVSAIYKKQRRFFKKKYDSEWVFSIYNLYSRQNPYFVYFTVDVNTDQPKAKQVSLLPIIPSFSYNFKF